MPELPEVETVRRGLALRMTGRQIVRAELRRPDLRRPFPPMLEHLRVSVGTAEEMDRFVAAFKEIFPAGRSSTAGV